MYKYAVVLIGQWKISPQSLAVHTDVSPHNKYLAEIMVHYLRSVDNSLGSCVLSGCSLHTFAMVNAVDNIPQPVSFCMTNKHSSYQYGNSGNVLLTLVKNLIVLLHYKL